MVGEDSASPIVRRKRPRAAGWSVSRVSRSAAPRSSRSWAEIWSGGFEPGHEASNRPTRKLDTSWDSVTNPANYLLVEAGSDGTFETLSCAGGALKDDAQVAVSGVTYDGGTIATVALLRPLPVGTYRLFVCGTTSITDLAGNPLNGGTDSLFDVAVLPITAVPALGPGGLALLALLLATAGVALGRRL